MKLCAGFEVVCPDGVVRHYPYHNHGDAQCDAEVYGERECTRGMSFCLPGSTLCPGGAHSVRPISLTHAEHEHEPDKRS